MGADGRGKGVRQCSQEEEEKMHTLPQHRQEHPPYLRSTGGKSERKNLYLACLAVLFVFSATTTTSIAAADDVSTTTSTVDADRTSSGFDYGDALTKSLLYFEAQRSGRLPHDHRVKWRGHSGLTDGLEQGVDLVGGYYDAGDHVKFGLPMAFTITMLSWGVIDYAAQLQEARELRHALAAIKWGADYFVKAHTKTNQLWAQVGDGHTDHYCWQRPEDMTTSRRAYRIDETHPGSDLAGETAAALAAASVAFRPGVGGVNDDDVDPGYADMLLRHARELFEFADKYRGRYDESVPGARHYYKSISGYNDELLWAALWLQKAETAAGNVGGARRYLDYVVENAFSMGGAGWAVAEFSWDIKYAGVQVLAAKLLLQGKHDDSHRDMLERYRSKADHYICSVMGRNTNGTNVRRTPAGLIYLRQWNNMQYVATATMLMTVYSDYLRASSSSSVVHCPGGDAGSDDLLEAARAQVDYVLGKNPVGISYLVGFGEKYPKRVHHRGASTVAHKESKGFIGCMQGYYDWYGRQKDNPNVLVGALVGGPDKEDVFRDVRGNFMQTEACTYNTAPLVGVFAKLNQVEKQREHQQIIKAAVVTESTLSASSSSLTPSLAFASI